jgi:uncharacterized membrane protein YdbT with pleckstrin-like domain
VSYIEQNLMSGESVISRAQIHWMIFLRAIVWTVVGVILALFAPFLGALVLFGALVVAGVAFVERSTTELAVTNRRVIGKRGIVSRQSVEVLLSKVEGLTVDQGILGRMFGFGTIKVGGSSTAVPFGNIVAPLEFRNAVQGQIEAGSAAPRLPQ